MSEEEEKGAARVVEANRMQLRLVPMDLEGLLAEDHAARAVWAFVGRLDLSEFHARIRAREGSAGRPAIDPRILLALWIMATLDGVGSARELERLCQYHLVYQWICGGVAVNHHTLSDFRNLSADLLSGLLTQSVGTLLNEGLVELKRVAQDGMKVRASAGGASFRRQGRLKEFQKIAREQIEILTRELEDDSGAGKRRQERGRERAAQDRAKRIERALKELSKAEEQKKKRSKDPKRNEKESRASMTDPESRVMKMADGGFRPAYNVHLVTAVGSGVIVAAEVNNDGTDQLTMIPLAEQVEKRHGKRPEEWLADAGCTSLANVDQMTERGCRLYAPVRAVSSATRRKDSEAVGAWRERMKTEEGKGVYKLRGQTAEWVNAQLRGQGLTRLLVRGLDKVRAVVMLHALTHNFSRTCALA